MSWLMSYEEWYDHSKEDRWNPSRYYWYVQGYEQAERDYGVGKGPAKAALPLKVSEWEDGID